MGQAKIKQRTAFSPELINRWEADDCVNFAVALVRLTGWLLHVDWWSTSIERREDVPLEELRPLRIYVANNGELIFDVRGIRPIWEFNQYILTPQIRKLSLGNGGVYTRFYGEEKLPSLPLRSQPKEEEIVGSIAAIQANSHYLAAIPVRMSSYIPAHEAARFTYGLCAAFAEALHELAGLQPIALLAIRFAPHFEGTKCSNSGYFHSVVLHSDGMAEDSWGKASLEDIAKRFGVIEFKTSADEHRAVVKKLRTSSADRYAAALKDASDLIRIYRPQNQGDTVS